MKQKKTKAILDINVTLSPEITKEDIEEHIIKPFYSKLTHKGYFGICPVYFGDLDTDKPLVIERHWSLIPLWFFSMYMFQFCFIIQTFIYPDYKPKWPLTITSKLN